MNVLFGSALFVFAVGIWAQFTFTKKTNNSHEGHIAAAAFVWPSKGTILGRD